VDEPNETQFVEVDLFSWRGDSSPMTRLRREMTMVEVELIPTKPEGQQDW